MLKIRGADTAAMMDALHRSRSQAGRLTKPMDDFMRAG